MVKETINHSFLKASKLYNIDSEEDLDDVDESEEIETID